MNLTKKLLQVLVIPIKAIITLAIKAYQLLISPWFGNCCRFYPTCSEYAITAYNLFNPLKASWLVITRILKCHPWHEGGYDPVPPNINQQS